MPTNDQIITELPVKTSSGITTSDCILGIDSSDGYQMLIQDLGDYIIQHATSNLSGSNQTVANAMLGKQATLVSGTNIKTVNNTSLLGSGNVAVQETLVSGTNIKTINNESILGSGNITIEGGGGSGSGGEWVSLGSTFFQNNSFINDSSSRYISTTIDSTSVSFIKFEFRVDASWDGGPANAMFQGLAECAFPANNSFSYFTIPITATCYFENSIRDPELSWVSGNLSIKLDRLNDSTLRLGFEDSSNDKSNCIKSNAVAIDGNWIFTPMEYGTVYDVANSSQLLTIIVTVLNTYVYYPSLTSASGVSF